MDRTIEYIRTLLPPQLALLLPGKISVREIRLRLNKPFTYTDGNSETVPDVNALCRKEDIELTTARISDYSLNSVRNELIQGFIRLKYGCRAGIAGQAVMNSGTISSVINISSINIRIAREIKGCSRTVIPEIVSGRTILPTLIASPPGMGKTTLLRDIARSLAGRFNTVIIDERSEISGIYHGEAQFDTGLMSDIIDSMPKPDAISAAVRTLSPDVIITDEIGSEKDADALIDAFRSGVSFVATAHAAGIRELTERRSLSSLFSEGIIKKAIILGNGSTIGSIRELVSL